MSRDRQNRPRSIHQCRCNIVQRLPGQKKLRYKENTTKRTRFAENPRSHVRILNYYMTQAVRGPITKMNQSQCSIAGLIFSMYRTGALSRMIPHLCLCSLCVLQSCNKSLINQACSGPYGPRACMVNKIYISNVAYWFVMSRTRYIEILDITNLLKIIYLGITFAERSS